MKKQIILNGHSIKDLPSFYEEINRVFMADEDWEIGPSLDALDDLLYGGFGVLKNQGEIQLVWKHISQSREALGHETTKAYYEAKLQPGSPFNVPLFQEKLRELESGSGPTYFDLILEIIAEHPTIELIALD
ncbi:barstar family protein [Siphonobacter curvatus]|uniref:Ribonuclease inhibitor n=1 Tax=Siphonobacter curvatus TaxID=2094562 RepID=A0A2S7IJT6_9BACT|nr:barstar family protein [Siphonobacter curvatus]PQA56903.1 ribonuclease inhibitor [Siphonobacter curvatus]